MHCVLHCHITFFQEQKTPWGQNRMASPFHLMEPLLYTFLPVPSDVFLHTDLCSPNLCGPAATTLRLVDSQKVCGMTFNKNMAAGHQGHGSELCPVCEIWFYKVVAAADIAWRKPHACETIPQTRTPSRCLTSRVLVNQRVYTCLYTGVWPSLHLKLQYSNDSPEKKNNKVTTHQHINMRT